MGVRVPRNVRLKKRVKPNHTLGPALRPVPRSPLAQDPVAVLPDGSRRNPNQEQSGAKAAHPHARVSRGWGDYGKQPFFHAAAHSGPDRDQCEVSGTEAEQS